MGCGSSKSVVVPAPQMRPQSQSEHPLQATSSQTRVQTLETIGRKNSSTSIGSKKSIKIRQNKVLPKIGDSSSIIKVQEADSQRGSNSSESDASQYSSRESISSSTRLISAHSTESKGSQDSGLGDDYTHMITEGSDSTDRRVANIPEGVEKPDLSIEGEKLNTLSSMGHRKRPTRLPPIQLSKGSASSSENSTPTSSQFLGTKRVTFSNDLIDELPDSPSIIKKPCAKGGLAFDIVMEDSLMEEVQARRKLVHLQKLEKKRGGTISHEELDEKQRVAEQRRKEQSQMLLERLRAKQEKDRQVAEALAKFAAMQTEIRNDVNKKIEVTTEKREAYLKAMRDRLREKSQRVEEVKKAKKIGQVQSTPQKDETLVNSN